MNFSGLFINVVTYNITYLLFNQICVSVHTDNVSLLNKTQFKWNVCFIGVIYLIMKSYNLSLKILIIIPVLMKEFFLK